MMGRKNGNRARTYRWFLLPALGYLAVFVLYPVLHNVSLSLRDVTAANIRLQPHPLVGAANYLELLQDSAFGAVLGNTALFTVLSIAFQFTIGFALAIYLNHRFFGRDLIRSAIILGWVLSPIVVGTIWRWILNTDFGLLNFILRGLKLIDHNISWLPRPTSAMVGVIMANVWLGIPFNMMLLTGGLANLPESVFESAMIDGANRVQRFLRITVPLLKQTIAATLMLGLIYTLKVFDLIWVMTNGGPVHATTTLPVWSYRLSFVLFDFGKGAAAANMLFVLTIVPVVFYIHRFAREEA